MVSSKNQNCESSGDSGFDAKTNQNTETGEGVGTLDTITQGQSDSQTQGHSTGPRTIQGKRMSSKNALTHGFFSREFTRNAPS